jgi:uncharacterized protein (TIGR02246 family)
MRPSVAFAETLIESAVDRHRVTLHCQAMTFTFSKFIRCATIAAIAVTTSAFADLREDEAAIRQVIRDTCKAYQDGNARRMAELLTEDFTLTDSGGTVTTRADDMANAESGAVRYELFENYDMTVRLYGDSSVVTGKTRVKGTAGSSAFAAEFQFTDTLVRRGGKWLFAASHASRLPAADPSTNVEQELRRLTQENLDAIAPGQVEVWRRNLHDNITHVDENGVVRNKTELLAEFSPLPKGLVGRLKIDKFKVTQEGSVAVASSCGTAQAR